MEIGFVTFNQEERSNVYKVLELLRDKGTLDELGIGRLRDAFSNRMFPGMSTLQGHAKYFAVLPSLFISARRKRYTGGTREVRDTVRRMEINLTKQLLGGTPESRRKGITGSDVIEQAMKDPSKYVKYDPTYIYNNGMATYNIIGLTGSIYDSILELSKEYNEMPEKLRETDKDIGDSMEVSLTYHKAFISTCGETYDFSRSDTALDLALTRREAEFIKTHMETSCDALLTYILKNDIPITDDYFALGELWEQYGVPEKYITPYHLSTRFSRFVHLLHIVYEATYAERTDDTETQDKMKEKFAAYIAQDSYRDASTPDCVETVLQYFADTVTEPTILRFCRNASIALSAYIAAPSKDKWEVLQKLVTDREQQAKGPKRSKLRNPENYRKVGHGLQGHLTYRWDLVKTMITEIREGLEHGKE